MLDIDITVINEMAIPMPCSQQLIKELGLKFNSNAPEQKLLSTPVLLSRLLARSFSIESKPEGKSRLHHGRIHLFALLIKGRSPQSASLHLPFERATKHKVTHLWSLIGSRTV